jgi:hypothetical protein
MHRVVGFIWEMTSPTQVLRSMLRECKCGNIEQVDLNYVEAGVPVCFACLSNDLEFDRMRAGVPSYECLQCGTRHWVLPEDPAL